MQLFAQLGAAVLKETRILARDREALGILFLMPAAFVLIMSLALRDVFSEESGARLPVLLVDRDGGRVGQALQRRLQDQGGLELTTDSNADASETHRAAEERLRSDVRAGTYRFAILVPEHASADAEARASLAVARDAAASGAQAPAEVTLAFFADPTLRAEHRALIVSNLNLGLAALSSEILAERVRALLSGGRDEDSKTDLPRLFRPLEDPLAHPSDDGTPTPTAVQQNAPGWGVLAMFFLVIPLAGTLVRERNEGNLQRLRTMSAPISLALLGKAVPYFLINQVQMALILLEGRYLVPLLGGDRLEFGHHPLALALLSMAISLAAIGYGLAVASFCKTSEQSTTFGAASVLILGAIGGVMVPKMVMPETMQSLTWISPMSWGLEGFLTVLVRGQGLAHVLPEIGALAAFGLACLTLGAWRFHWRFEDE
jgi:ABC-2 type transport system permease protein